jgi:uncharacterized protein (TIRG00374 family)
MKKNWVRLGIIFLLTFVFLYFFFRSVRWTEVLSYLTDINILLFVLLIFLSPLHLLTRGLRWIYLLKHKKQGVKLSHAFAGNAVGFMVTFIFPGRLGELAKPLYLARKEGMRKGYVLGTVVVERMFDMFTMCFLLGLFLLSKPLYSSFFKVQAETYSKLYLWGVVGVAIASALLIFSLALYFFRAKTLALISFLLKPFPKKLTQKALELSDEFIEGVKFFHSVGNVLVYGLLSIAVWLGITFYYWVFFFAYHVSIPFFLLIPYIFFTMVGASIPTPGMAGGYHYFSKLGMTSLYGLDPNRAVSMTIVFHALQLVVTCLLGYAILWKEGLSLFQLKKLGENQNP